MIYLTVGNKFGGIYKSQVLGSCQFMNSISDQHKVRCVSFLPVRGFFAERRRIKNYDPDVIVFPVFFKSHFGLPLIPVLALICLLGKERSLMGRGAFATRLGLQLKRLGIIDDVIYDGRGAHVAEIEEYTEATKDVLEAGRKLERTAVIESTYRLAVSTKLVKYWRERFGYKGQNHVVIPCTIDQVGQLEVTGQEKQQLRQTLGLPLNAITLVYSGAAQSYQSFHLLDQLLGDVFRKRKDVYLLLLSNVSPSLLALNSNYPERVKTAWLKPEQVPTALSLCDYGLLLRAPSVTNQVAAPTKFAEYLAAGLPVVITDGIGDYSEAVVSYGVGEVVDPGQPFVPDLIKATEKERSRIKLVANEHFTKQAYLTSYQKIIEKSNR